MNAIIASYAMEKDGDGKLLDGPNSTVEKFSSPEDELEYGPFGTIKIMFSRRSKNVPSDGKNSSDVNQILSSASRIEIQLSNHHLAPFKDGYIAFRVDGEILFSASGNEKSYTLVIPEESSHKKYGWPQGAIAEIEIPDTPEGELSISDGEHKALAELLLGSLKDVLFNAMLNFSQLSAIRPSWSSGDIAKTVKEFDSLVEMVNSSDASILSNSSDASVSSKEVFQRLNRVVNGDVGSDGKYAHALERYYRHHYLSLQKGYPDEIMLGNTLVFSSQDNPEERRIPFFVYVAFWVKRLLGYYFEGDINRDFGGSDQGDLWCATTGPHGEITDRFKFADSRELEENYNEGLDNRPDLVEALNQRRKQIEEIPDESERKIARKFNAVTPLNNDLEDEANYHACHPSCLGAGMDALLPQEYHSTGYHQVFPIIIQAGLKKRGQLMAIENPEAHLHPKLQGDLMDFLIGEANSGKQILIETHSDVMIYRTQVAILEETLRQQGVYIYFHNMEQIQPISKRSRETPSTACLQRIEVGDDGRFSNWPEGFLDQSEKEISKMLSNLPDVGFFGDNEEYAE